MQARKGLRHPSTHKDLKTLPVYTQPPRNAARLTRGRREALMDCSACKAYWEGSSTTLCTCSTSRDPLPRSYNAIPSAPLRKCAARITSESPSASMASPSIPRPSALSARGCAIHFPPSAHVAGFAMNGYPCRGVASLAGPLGTPLQAPVALSGTDASATGLAFRGQNRWNVIAKSVSSAVGASPAFNRGVWHDGSGARRTWRAMDPAATYAIPTSPPPAHRVGSVWFCCPPAKNPRGVGMVGSDSKTPAVLPAWALFPVSATAACWAEVRRAYPQLFLVCLASPARRRPRPTLTRCDFYSHLPIGCMTSGIVDCPGTARHSPTGCSVGAFSDAAPDCSPSSTSSASVTDQSRHSVETIPRYSPISRTGTMAPVDDGAPSSRGACVTCPACSSACTCASVS